MRLAGASSAWSGTCVALPILFRIRKVFGERRARSFVALEVAHGRLVVVGYLLAGRPVPAVINAVGGLRPGRRSGGSSAAGPRAADDVVGRRVRRLPAGGLHQLHRPGVEGRDITWSVGPWSTTRPLSITTSRSQRNSASPRSRVTSR